jgi:hypothetical protein
MTEDTARIIVLEKKVAALMLTVATFIAWSSDHLGALATAELLKTLPDPFAPRKPDAP